MVTRDEASTAVPFRCHVQFPDISLTAQMPKGCFGCHTTALKHTQGNPM